MKLKFLPALLMFVSSYFPLVLIFVIKDWDDRSMRPAHPETAAAILLVALAAVAVVLVAARKIEGGISVHITRMSNKSGDMFTYTIPYMISFYNFNFGDWKTIASLFVFMSLMFALSYRTQFVFINPVLALARYSLFECQFKDGAREVSGLLISRHTFQINETCIIQQLSSYLYFVTGVQEKAKEK